MLFASLAGLLLCVQDYFYVSSLFDREDFATHSTDNLRNNQIKNANLIFTTFSF